MQTTAFLIKLLGFMAWASLIAWIFGWYGVKWSSRLVAAPGLRGEGGRGQLWRLWLAALIFAGIVAVLSWFIHESLAPVPPAIADNAGPWDASIALLSTLLSWLGLGFVCGAGPATVVWYAYGRHQSILRRQTLKKEATDLSKVRESQDEKRQDGKLPLSGRRIVICCDGTGKRPDRIEEGRPAVTNVYKMYGALTKDEEQVVWYDPGVGTDTSPGSMRFSRVRVIAKTIGIAPLARLLWFWVVLVRLIEAATGRGTRDNVIEAYTFLASTYQPGDRIYLIGFSRGAWTVRCLAAVIAFCGVLKPSYIRYAEDVVHFLGIRECPDDPVRMCADVTDMSARVAFLGVFDTVAALGVPLWGWWFRSRLMSPKLAWSSNPATACDAIYHTVSMDERRSQYFVTLFDEAKMGDRIEQVWFRGDHSDVGGGRADTALSDITLEWMIDKARTHDLTFKDETKLELSCDSLGRIHDELEVKRRWRLFGSWPRWFPTHRAGEGTSNGYGTLHKSVHERAIKMHNLGRTDLRFLTGPDPHEMEVPSNSEWFRSGVVLESGQTYRITWLEGKWRDKAHLECGPDGEKKMTWWRRLLARMVRRLKMPRIPLIDEQGQPTWNKNGQEVPRMTLTATHAHPRRWAPAEYGLRDLGRYFFKQDPKELVEQLAPIGKDLSSANSAVCLQIGNDIPNGMLWLFANDTWIAASDNSGVVRLKIEHVDAPEPNQPLWRLKHEAKIPPRAVWRRLETPAAANGPA